MKTFKLLSIIFLLTGFLAISVNVGYANEIPVIYEFRSVDVIFNNDTLWEDREVVFDLTEPINVEGTGNLTIINSHILINGPINGIEVQNGGNLTIIDSIIEFNGTDHAIFGSTNGKVTLINATLTSLEGDASHFEGNYLFNVDKSTFRDSGDDGFHVSNNNLPFTVSNSYFLNNGDDGFDLLEVDSKVILQSGTIISNKGHAVKMTIGTNLTVMDTFIDGIGSASDDDNRGMDIEDGISLFISNVTIQNFPSDGIKVQRTPTMIKSVDIINVGDEGIEFENTNHEFPVFVQSSNILNAKGGDGIKVENVVGKVVLNNTKVENSNGDGIKVDNVVGKVTLNNINVVNSGDDGIQVTKGNTTLEVFNTYVGGSFEDGFELDSSISTIIANVSVADNTENGVKLKNIGEVTLTSLNAYNNGFFGIDGLNVSSLVVDHLNVSSNQGGGYKLITSNRTIVTNSVFSNNIETNALSHGIIIEGIPDFQINDSSIEANSGSGFEIFSSKGVVSNNEIYQNQNNGITIQGNSDIVVLNNRINSNDKIGISVSNSSLVLVQLNILGGNGLYGLFVDQGNNNTIIANENYWGSNEGPIYQGESTAGRDGILGNIQIDNILNENGEILPYTPPEEVNFEQLFYIVLVGLGITIFLSIVIYFILRTRWKNSTNPLALIYISRVGLPILEHNFREMLVDPALISGFLSAISSFGAEVYKSEDKKNIDEKEIREIQSKENVILLYIIERSMLALVIENSNPVVKSYFKKMAKELIKLANLKDGEEFDQKINQITNKEFYNLIDENFSGIN